MEASALRRVRVPKTAELVAGEIRRQIIRGDLREGDNLPPEAELTEQLGVSRPTLREAFRILESEALLSVRRGVRTGPTIHAPDPEIAARHTGLLLQWRGATLADVYQARTIIVPPTARLLADDHARADIATLSRFVAELEAVADDSARFLTRTAEFNVRLVDLAGNQTLSILAGQLNDIIELHLAAVAPDWARENRIGEAKKVTQAMRKLIDLIDRGRGADAERFWREQMEASAAYSLRLHGARTVVELLS